MNAVSHGNRPRSWDTRVGTIELAVPKVRPGSHYPSLLQPRRRAEQALRAWWGRLHGWSPGSDTEGMSQHTHTVTVRLAMGAPLVRRLDAVAARDDEPLQRGGTSAFRVFMSSGHLGVWSPRVAGMGDSLSLGYDGEYSRQPGTAEYSF